MRFETNAFHFRTDQLFCYHGFLKFYTPIFFTIPLKLEFIFLIRRKISTVAKNSGRLERNLASLSRNAFRALLLNFSFFLQFVESSPPVTFYRGAVSTGAIASS